MSLSVSCILPTVIASPGLGHNKEAKEYARECRTVKDDGNVSLVCIESQQPLGYYSVENPQQGHGLAETMSAPDEVKARIVLVEETTTSPTDEPRIASQEFRYLRLLALALGVLEMYFSADNAIMEDAFSFKDARSLIFVSSTLMQSVGLAVTVSSSTAFRKLDSHEGYLPRFGEPLALLAIGFRQHDDSIIDIANTGVVIQALAVLVPTMAYLYSISSAWFTAMMLFCTLSACGCVLISWASLVTRLDNGTPLLSSPVISLIVSCWKVLLSAIPLTVDIAEVMLLIASGLSWRTGILAFLDFCVISVVTVPWGGL